MDVKMLAMAVVIYVICGIRSSMQMNASALAGLDPELQVCQPLNSYLKNNNSMGNVDTVSCIGQKGQKGRQGKRGTRGYRGKPGIPGEAGVKGETGERGSKGDMGLLGPEGRKGDIGEPGVSKHGLVPLSQLRDLPTCDSSMRGALRVVPNATNGNNVVDNVLICRVVGNGNFNWTSLQEIDGTSAVKEDKPDNCLDVLKELQATAQPELTGVYHIYDSFGTMANVWCDMSTTGGGWMLIGKSFQPNMWQLRSTRDTLTLKTSHAWASYHGWSSRFGRVMVSEFRVQMITGSYLNITCGHWYHRLAHPRPLSLIFTYGGTNGCNKDGITDIDYTFDIRGGTRNENHRCAAFQDTGSPSVPINEIFNTTDYTISGNDGAFSFHAYKANSGTDDDSTAFFGCDDLNCCMCWGPVGGQDTYCNNCSPKNGGTSTKQGYALFYVR